MDKLKTLKNIGELYNGSVELKSDILDHHDIVKDAAEKWIAALEKYERSWNTDDIDIPQDFKKFFFGDSSYPGISCSNLIAWIKYFFDLEE